jgi:hypothetical protein
LRNKSANLRLCAGGEIKNGGAALILLPIRRRLMLF